MRGTSNGVPKVGAGTGDKIAHPRGKPRLLGDLEDEVIREDGGAGRLPHAHVAHDGGGEAEVPPDGREVEGGDGSYEPLQPPLLHPVPDIGGVVWMDLE